MYVRPHKTLTQKYRGLHSVYTDLIELYCLDDLSNVMQSVISLSLIVMRTIGIPCRPVTNFSSAHDSDGNCSNDRYYGDKGELLKEKSADSVW